MRPTRDLRRLLAWLMAILIAAVLVTGSVSAQAALREPSSADLVTGSTPARAAQPPRDPTSADGALYTPSVLGLRPALGLPHYCSASVVHSPEHDLLITAAHCVYGTGASIEFAPGYHDGKAPYGVWDVTAAYVEPAWRISHDPRADVAILRVAPLHARNVEDVVGAHPLGSAPPAGTRVTVTGYAQGSDDEARRCATTTYETEGYPSIDCDGFVNGTSGGPWVDRAGNVVGVIGGLYQGGCVEDTSYSAPFGVETAKLLARAEAHESSDQVLPVPSTGCPP